jgi:hypothetical protein
MSACLHLSTIPCACVLVQASVQLSGVGAAVLLLAAFCVATAQTLPLTVVASYGQIILQVLIFHGCVAFASFFLVFNLYSLLPTGVRYVSSSASASRLQGGLESCRQLEGKPAAAVIPAPIVCFSFAAVAEPALHVFTGA